MPLGRTEDPRFPHFFALCSTVACWFRWVLMLGSVSLLILKHDTPADARLIVDRFSLYCTAAMATGTMPDVAGASI